MGILFIAAIIGIIPAMIASKKGRSGFTWWLYGTLLFIIALPHSLLIQADEKLEDDRQLQNGGKRCPDCAEIVRAEARKCRFCGSDISNTQPPSATGYASDLIYDQTRNQRRPSTWQKLWWNPHANDPRDVR